MKNFHERNKEIGTLMGQLGMEVPEVLKSFGALHAASFKPGALDVKTKELVALGIAIAIRCDGCIAAHVEAAVKEGVTKEEVVEVISVSIVMGGGPSLVYGVEALQALTQFQELAN